MKKYIKITILYLILIVAVFLSVNFVLDYGMPSIHKAGIASSLKDWGMQYSNIQNANDVVHAVEMLGYINNYYSGYDDDGDVYSDRLKKQRTETLQVIMKALDEYTGENIGNDIQKWEDWLRQKGVTLRGDWFKKKQINSGLINGK